MRYLIDTNILLWYISGNKQLPEEYVEIISKNRIYLSIASLWEIVIKQSIGKLTLDFDIFEKVNTYEEEQSLKIIQIDKKHLLFLRDLDFISKDPFDRIIYSTAKAERMRFLYTDKIFDEYNKL